MKTILSEKIELEQRVKVLEDEVQSLRAKIEILENNLKIETRKRDEAIEAMDRHQDHKRRNPSFYG